ncbi:antitoxin Xre/MbcA/ParS toxin-binding domain-containing protein [Pseudoalteromonas sp. NGC95]|uniref:antitoxin Xre/MbcA/ParS toxin-binding domain-containing protein n=1 Tax=Pseudoalteromonas sp. NGC95 TaxID=2792051 RepID=UPI0018CDDEBC|nr:antitoxin Xre/MbcA/ParS toxin-binding domain-containing protein [Pseudoalteromonas sp. NGC95]MBH0018711.1 DUF2384 domain-containing protein [Pseudoalteromonas sp. NGC95]
MRNYTNDIFQQDPKRAYQVTLSVFFRIMDKWNLEHSQQIILLGSPQESLFQEWLQNKVENISDEVLIRISYILGIYKGLGLIFNKRSQADSWINKPNKKFNQLSALEFMLNGEIEQLEEVRKYVDRQFGF